MPTPQERAEELTEKPTADLLADLRALQRHDNEYGDGEAEAEHVNQTLTAGANALSQAAEAAERELASFWEDAGVDGWYAALQATQEWLNARATALREAVE